MEHTSHNRLLAVGALTACVAAVVATAPLAASAIVRDPASPIIALTSIDDSVALQPVHTIGHAPLLTRIGDQLVRGDNLTGAPSAAGLNAPTTVRHSADVTERLARGPQTSAPTTVHHSADVTERLATPTTRLPKPNAPR